MDLSPDASIIRSLFRFGLPAGMQGIAMNVAGVMLVRFIGSLPESMSDPCFFFGSCSGICVELANLGGSALRRRSAFRRLAECRTGRARSGRGCWLRKPSGRAESIAIALGVA